MAQTSRDAEASKGSGFRYAAYNGEEKSCYLPAIKQLISKDLSEPYSIYVYRYFLYQWGDLCFMVRSLHRGDMCQPLIRSTGSG